MNVSDPMELGVYGGFVILVLREVLRFAKDAMTRKNTELAGLREEVMDEMRNIKRQIATMTDNASDMLGELKIAQDRENRFWNRDWPAMVSSVASVTRRVTAAETGLALVQERLNINSDMTPPRGTRIVSLTPSQGVPVIVEDED